MEEVKTRLTEELRLRTEERVRHWDRLSDWCRQRPGRYIGVDWRSGLRSSSGIRVGEATAEAVVVAPPAPPTTLHRSGAASIQKR